MKKKSLLLVLFISTLMLSIANADSSLIQPLVAKSDFYQIGHLNFRLKAKGCYTRHYTSNKTRLWYSFFPAEETPESKPLFVFLNGGPGCATSTNLFAMNTAPYTLDRAIVDAPNETFAENEYSWAKMGNLLYIDAPNTGFSYMLSNVSSWDPAGLVNEFTKGSNYNSFIDADQVLRVVLNFLKENPSIQKNKVIFVGESYSGVRVSTILNLLLFYKDYADGKKVFRDKTLGNIIKKHFDAVMPEPKDSYTPEDVALQFNRQILIQPQITDKYQCEIQNEMYRKPDSVINTLKPLFGDKNYEWFLENYGDANQATMLYLRYIDVDQYNCSKYWSWSDHNEEFAMKALLDTNDLSKITKCDVTKINYLKPSERKKALRFMIDKNQAKWITNPLIKNILDKLNQPFIKLWLESVPHNLVHPIPSMYQDKVNSLEEKLGKLNEYDSYMVGTNIYAFLSFMLTSGFGHGGYRDIYDIGAGKSTRYGRMFLENLTLVETFMTDAKLDLVVYSPTLPAQFDSSKGRFTDIVEKVVSNRGNVDKNGKFTIFYKAGSVKSIKEVPALRTVVWPHYETSGHSVSSTQPKKFMDDVYEWVFGFQMKIK